MKISCRPADKIAIVILVVLSTCPGCITEEATAVKPGVPDAGENDENVSVMDTAEKDSISGNKDTEEVNLDLFDTSETDAGHADDDESESATTAVETDSLSMNDSKDCQLECYKQGKDCVGPCSQSEGTICSGIGKIQCNKVTVNVPPRARKPCESTCLKKVKSCLAECASSNNTGPQAGGLADCTLQCDEVDQACNTMCFDYKNVDSNKACGDLCTEQKKSCESQC